MRWWCLVGLVACGSDPLIVTPTFVDFGEVDFQQPRPETGYNEQVVQLQNSGKSDLDLQISGIDEERVFVGAFWQSQADRTLPTISGGSYADITMSVWDYEPGELTTTITGSIRVQGNGLSEPVVIDWSYVPIRNIPGETGEE